MVHANSSTAYTDKLFSLQTDKGKTYTTGSERLISWLVRVELALGIAHRVCISSGHVEDLQGGIERRQSNDNSRTIFVKTYSC